MFKSKTNSIPRDVASVINGGVDDLLVEYERELEAGLSEGPP